MRYPPMVGAAQSKLYSRPEKRAPAAALLESLRTFKFPCGMSEEEWAFRATKIVGDAAAADLSWLSEKRQKIFSVQIRTLSLRRAFVRFMARGIHAGRREAEGVLSCSFVLDGWRRRRTPQYFISLGTCWQKRGEVRSDGSCGSVLWMKRSGRLKGEISFQNLELAVALAEESSRMYWWPEERWEVMRWSRGSQPYVELMGHSSYLVRAAAADCLGLAISRLFKANPCAEAAEPVASILSLAEATEQKTRPQAWPGLS